MVKSALVFLFLIAVEVGYRAFIYAEFPARFDLPTAKGDVYVEGKAPHIYDERFGYSYSTDTLNMSHLRDGVIVGCTQYRHVNDQGNFGVPVFDFHTAEIRVLIFGDSFSLSPINGTVWPNLLQSKLEEATGRTVRVMNLGRDGYGMAQMIDLAAVKIPELRPTLAIFAMNSQALARARTWRVVSGAGKDVRHFTTTQNTSNPDASARADMLLLMPEATYDWCLETKKLSPEAQRTDSVVLASLEKSRIIRSENSGELVADIFDLTASYVFDLVLHGQPFHSQWHYKQSAPRYPYTDFREDEKFLAAIKKIEASRVPLLFAHLPMGVSLQGGDEFWHDAQGEALLGSLPSVVSQPFTEMMPYLDVPQEKTIELCVAPNNCHPSLFGMEVYADAVVAMIDNQELVEGF